MKITIFYLSVAGDSKYVEQIVDSGGSESAMQGQYIKAAIESGVQNRDMWIPPHRILGMHFSPEKATKAK